LLSVYESAYLFGMKGKTKAKPYGRIRQ